MKTMPRRRRLQVLLALLVVTVLVTAGIFFKTRADERALSPEDTQAIIKDPIERLVRTSDAWRFELTIGRSEEVKCTGSRRPAVSEGTGAIEHSDWAAECTFDLSSLIGSGETTVDIRVVNRVTYIRAPALALLGLDLPGEKSWIQLGERPPTPGSPTTTAPPEGAGGIIFGNLLSRIVNLDIEGFIDRFIAAFVDIDKVGIETVRGVKTTKHTGLFGLSLVPTQKLQDFDDPVGLMTLLVGPHRRPADVNIELSVWVDSRGLLRKATLVNAEDEDGGAGEAVSEDVSGATGADKPAVANAGPEKLATFEAFDFGSAVDIAAPSTQDAATLEEIIASLILGQLTAGP